MRHELSDHRCAPRVVRRTLAAAALLGAALAAACCGDKPPIAGGDTPMVSASEAASVEVHPLSRVACPAEGPCQLLVHVAVNDVKGKPVRVPGRLRVTIEPPPGVAPDSAPRAWDVDLADPDGGGATYDAVITHTYALRLAGLPAWLESWARGDRAPGPDDAPAPTVRVILDLGPRTLTADRVLTR